MRPDGSSLTHGAGGVEWRAEERGDGGGGPSYFTGTSGDEILPCSVWGRGLEPGVTVSPCKAPKMNGETSETFFPLHLAALYALYSQLSNLGLCLTRSQ